MRSVLETPEKNDESLKTQLQGGNVQEIIRQEANLTISPLAITKSANESENRKDISAQDKKMLFQQGVILPKPVVPEHIIVPITKPSNFHGDAIVSVPQIFILGFKVHKDWFLEDKAWDNQFNFLALPLQLEKQSNGAKNEVEPKFPNSRRSFFEEKLRPHVLVHYYAFDPKICHFTFTVFCGTDEICEAELNLDNVLDMNGQFPFVQKKNQMEKNTENNNDSNEKQEIPGDYGDNALEDG
ncbi:hypothetical protein DINM_001126 [Dirofilaria immitis]|nr:hypothetical protein [Dirofilaria immitis]